MNPETLAEEVASGDRRLHELEEAVEADVATEARRLLLENDTGVSPQVTGDYAFDAAVASANIENMIGATQIPVGVAGPVSVHGEAQTDPTYLPIATTEGALVASVNRGCSVIDSAGGANARVFSRAMTRAPVFRVSDIPEAEALIDWVHANTDRLAEVAESTTSHGEFLEVDPYVVGNNVYLRFAFDPKDAMGMNMVTIATEAACDLIEDETSAELVALSGNLCTDKKPAAINAIQGRGRTVSADIVVPEAVITERLHTDPASISELNTRKNHIGSAKAGSYGFNAQAANVIAGMFLATGQDAAQVVEGANVITTTEVREGDLYASVTLSSLEVGTVGGGTKLPTQTEALELIGLQGGGDPPGRNADALAEVVAVGVLAGELSLLGALAARHLSTAHQSLGR